MTEKGLITYASYCMLSVALIVYFFTEIDVKDLASAKRE